jgi:hypothetical protein
MKRRFSKNTFSGVCIDFDQAFERAGDRIRDGGQTKVGFRRP